MAKDTGGKEENKKFVRYVKEAGMSAALVTPQVIKPGEEWVLEELSGCGADAILARNLAAIALLRGKGTEVIADATLNAVNEITVQMLHGWGARRVTFGADAAGGGRDARGGDYRPGTEAVGMERGRVEPAGQKRSGQSGVGGPIARGDDPDHRADRAEVAPGNPEHFEHQPSREKRHE